MKITINNNGSQAIYQQIKEQLKAYIIENNLKEGERLPDLQSIADAAGVSLRTAYLGIDALIKEGICYKRPKNGIFVRHKLKKIAERNMCAVYDKRLVGNYELNSDLIQQAIFKGISENIDTYRLEPFFITGNPDDTIEFYSHIEGAKLSGILMLYWDDLDEGMRLAERFPQMKFVYLNYFIDGFEQTPENIYGVFNDDFSGAYDMASRIALQGYENAKILTFELPDENYRRRVNGFVAGLEDKRFKRNTVLSAGPRRERSLQKLGRDLIAESWKSNKKTDVVFCVNDLMAEGVFEWLKEKKINNVRVCGYDNILRHVTADRNLSTVSINFEKMGLAALDIIAGKIKKCPKIIRIPPQIIERHTP